MDSATRPKKHSSPAEWIETLLKIVEESRLPGRPQSVLNLVNAHHDALQRRMEGERALPPGSDAADARRKLAALFAEEERTREAKEQAIASVRKEIARCEDCLPVEWVEQRRELEKIRERIWPSCWIRAEDHTLDTLEYRLNEMLGPARRIALLSLIPESLTPDDLPEAMVIAQEAMNHKDGDAAYYAGKLGETTWWRVKKREQVPEASTQAKIKNYIRTAQLAVTAMLRGVLHPSEKDTLFSDTPFRNKIESDLKRSA